MARAWREHFLFPQSHDAIAMQLHRTRVSRPYRHSTCVSPTTDALIQPLCKCNCTNKAFATAHVAANDVWMATNDVWTQCVSSGGLPTYIAGPELKKRTQAGRGPDAGVVVSPKGREG
eukprot:gene13681-biopygen2015